MSALSPRGEKGADEVLRVFDSLLANAVRPNTITYVSVIRAWGDKGDWQQAEKVRCRSRQQLQEGDLSTVHAVLPLASRVGSYYRIVYRDGDVVVCFAQEISRRLRTCVFVCTVVVRILPTRPVMSARKNLRFVGDNIPVFSPLQ